MPNSQPPRMKPALTLLFACLALTMPRAQEAPTTDSNEDRTTVTDGILLPEIAIIGSEKAIATLPASGAYIGAEQIARYGTADIGRILQQVPGVYSRGEDGYGLFPNISLRGVTTERMKAVTMMEDGILTAPAPYSAPSAYYSPNIARMSGLEILKGSSQIKFGPHITGGAINYISTAIPVERQSFLKLAYGSNNEFITHAWHGANEDLGKYGTVGYVIEGFFHRTDGFKTIDAAPGITHLNDTGFTRFEPMVKIFWEPGWNVYHRFEVKYGHTDLEADETYLGLTTTDFRNDPNRRYSASRFDNIETENHRASIRYIFEPTANLRIATTGYLQYFKRNWEKLHQLRGPNVAISTALLDTAAGGGLAVLQGTAAGTLRIRNNAREYKIYGGQTAATANFDLGETEHKLEFGVRAHFDEVDRFQWNIDYAQNAAGAITGATVGALGAGGDRVQQSFAVALHAQDEIKWNKFTLTPGMRFETVDQEFEQDMRRLDAGGTPASGDGRLDAFGGGASLGYEITPKWIAFAGAHQGFSIPGPRASIRSGLDEETSLSFEAGTRFVDADRGLRAELVFFRSDFNDLVVGGNLGGGGAATTENVGNINSLGVEMLVEYDAGRANDWVVRTPARLSLTLTDAQLDGNATNTDPESLFEGGVDGSKVPYIPEYQINAEIGVEYEKLGAYLNMTYVPQTYTTASNSRDPIRSDGVGGTVADARVGKTDNYFVTDFNLRYQLNESITLFGGVKNILNRGYIASLHPHGPRPGLPRFFNVGMEARF
jgi:Fe(3+) dicitrate transport protein